METNLPILPPTPESLTQLNPGSSTRRLPASLMQQNPTGILPANQPTEKESKASYALPIQTLQALSNPPLTQIPNKSWAQIAEEEEETLALSQMMQGLKQQIAASQVRPQPQLALPSSQNQVVLAPQPINTAKPSQPAVYFVKTHNLTIIQMESYFWQNNPKIIHTKIFPNGFHFKPLALNKTQKFYEFILVDSDSIGIKHYKDTSGMVTHSTVQILKVLSFSDWGQDPNQIKKFSQNFDPMGYNYWDYQQAWYSTFWYQNSEYKHSWLFYFKQSSEYTFPLWFSTWWNIFGPVENIFPPNVSQGFKVFQQNSALIESPFPLDLHFFSIFALSWIFQWQYKFEKNPNPHMLPILKRQLSVKWWPSFDSSRANEDQIHLWFKKNPQFLKASNPEVAKFLNQKSQINASLASITTKHDMMNQLQNMLDLLKSEEGQTSSQQHSSQESQSKTEALSQDYAQSNEDDCFGIDLANDL